MYNILKNQDVVFNMYFGDDHRYNKYCFMWDPESVLLQYDQLRLRGHAQDKGVNESSETAYTRGPRETAVGSRLRTREI